MSEPKEHEDFPRMAQEAPAGARVNDMPNVESADIAREAAQIAALHQEIATLKDKYLRAVAEIENVRRRAEKEKSDAAQFAFSRFAADLLTVADNFERAFQAMKPEQRSAIPGDVMPVFEGIEATQRQLTSIFERHGIKRIEALGQKFNPSIHEAIAEVPSPGKAAGTIVAVVETGYSIGQRLLRAARVAIAASQPDLPSGSRPDAPPPGSTIDTQA